MQTGPHTSFPWLCPPLPRQSRKFYDLKCEVPAGRASAHHQRPLVVLGAGGALAAPPTVKPFYRHQGECELEPECEPGFLPCSGGGPGGMWQEAFPERGSGGAPRWWHLCGAPWGQVAQGDPEQGERRGLGGWAEGEPGVPQLIPSSLLCFQHALLQQLNFVDFSRL